MRVPRFTDRACRRRELESGRAAIAVTVAAAASLVPANEADAKLSGRVHCYRGVCHRVLSLAETRKLVGTTRLLLASAYDSPSVDGFNRNAFTSNGERFNARDAGRVAAADLPDGTLLLLRNPVNGRTSHVLVNDFGPFYRSRTIDATRRVAEDLGFLTKGVTPLEVTVLAAPKPEDAGYKKGRRLSGALGHIGTVSPGEAKALIAELVDADETLVAAADREPSAPSAGGATAPGPLADAANHLLPSRDAASTGGAAPPRLASVAPAAGVADGAEQPRAADPGLAAAAPAAVSRSSDAPAAQPTDATRPPISVLGGPLIVAIAAPDAGPALALDNTTADAEPEPAAETWVEPFDIASLALDSWAKPAAEQTTVLVAALPALVAEERNARMTSLDARFDERYRPAFAELLTGTRNLVLGRGSLRTASSAPASLLAMAGTMTAFFVYMLYAGRGQRRLEGITAGMGPASAARTLRPTTDDGSGHGLPWRLARGKPPRLDAPGGDGAPAATARFANANDTHSDSASSIGPDLTIKGSIRTPGVVRVAGRLEGSIEAGTLVIERFGVVEASVTAETVVIEGRIKGTITARRLVATATATVDADILTGTLAIDHGAIVHGRIRTTVRS